MPRPTRRSTAVGQFVAYWQNYFAHLWDAVLSCGYQDFILGHAEMDEMIEFRQNEKTLGDRGLNLGYFFAEIFKEGFL